MTLTRNKETKESYISASGGGEDLRVYHVYIGIRGRIFRSKKIRERKERERVRVRKKSKSLNLIKWRCGLSVRDVNAQERNVVSTGGVVPRGGRGYVASNHDDAIT